LRLFLKDQITMPIYAYKCNACGFAKDVLQKISDPLLTDCPQCGAATFTKQLTAAGFQLKGSGWYATDFKGGGAAPAPAKAPAEGASAPAAGAEPAAAPKADAAPAAPAAAAASCGGGCACHS
jgi:putative FmdB family regulatory protein